MKHDFDMTILFCTNEFPRVYWAQFIRNIKKKITTCYDHDDRSHRLRNSYMLALSAIDRGSRPCRVKPNTIKLVFVASPLSMQH